MLNILLVFLAVGGLTTVTPPYLTGVLGAPISAVGFTVMMVGCGAIIGRLTSGILLRRFTPGAVSIVAASIDALSLLVSALVPELWWFYACRLLQGFGSAVFHSATFTQVLDDGGPARSGRAIALASVPLFVGTALGPLVGELLVRAVGSEWALPLLAAPVLFVVCSLALQRSVAQVDRESADVASPRPAARGLRRRLAWRITRVVYPGAIVPAACWVFVGSAWQFSNAYLPLYALEVGLPVAGPLFLVFSVVVIALRLGGASWFDRIPSIPTAIAGGVCAAVGAALLAFVPSPVTTYIAVILLATNTGIGFGSLMKVATVSAPHLERGAAVSTYSMSFDIGSMVNVSLLGLVVQATHTFTYAYAITLLGAVAGTLGIVALGLSIRRRRRDAPTGSLPIISTPE